MPRIRHRGPHGGGVHIRMDRCLTNQDLDDFVNGNFQALQARRDLGTPQDYRTMNNRRLAVQVYIETIEASLELRDLALNALQRAAIATTLRRASLIRQHEEVLARTVSPKLVRELTLRLVDLKQRNWTTFFSDKAGPNIRILLDQLANVQYATSEGAARFRGLNQQFQQGDTRHPVSQRYYPARWDWE